MKASQYTEKAKPVQMGISFLLMAGAIAALAGCTYALAKMIKDEPDTMKQAAIYMAGIVALLGAFTVVMKFTKDVNFKEISVFFFSFAVLIGTITFCISLLAGIPPEDISKATLVVGGSMALIITMLSQLSKITETKGAGGRTIAIIGSIIATMGAILGMIVVLSDYSVTDLLKSGTVITFSMLLIKYIVKEISEAVKGVKKTGGALAVMGGFLASMGAVIGGIVLFQQFNQARLAISSAILLASTYLMSKIFAEIAKTNPKKKSIDNFIKCAGAVVLLAGAIALVNVSGDFVRTAVSAAGLLFLVTILKDVFIQIQQATMKSKAITNFIKASLAVVVLAAAIAIANVSGNFLETAAAAFGLSILVDTLADAFEKIQACTMKTKAIYNFLIAAAAVIELAIAIAIANVSGNFLETATSAAGLTILVQRLSDVFIEIQKANVKTKAIYNFLIAAAAVIELAVAVAIVNLSGNIAETIVSTASLRIFVTVFMEMISP